MAAAARAPYAASVHAATTATTAEDTRRPEASEVGWRATGTACASHVGSSGVRANGRSPAPAPAAARARGRSRAGGAARVSWYDAVPPGLAIRPPPPPPEPPGEPREAPPALGFVPPPPPPPMAQRPSI